LSSDEVIKTADEWVGAKNAGHDYGCMALSAIRVYRNEMINAMIKIKISAILALFVVMMWGAIYFPAQLWGMKTTIKILPCLALNGLFIFMLLSTDYWMPLFYPLMHIFNRLAGMQFGWLLTGCALLFTAAYLLMKRRFNSLEVGILSPPRQ
jgi:hypothetical protein